MTVTRRQRVVGIVAVLLFAWVFLYRFNTLGGALGGFDNDHYDYPEERREELIALGATPVTGRELLRRLQRAGLRVKQRNKRPK